jgi:hypothetical protein
MADTTNEETETSPITYALSFLSYMVYICIVFVVIYLFGSTLLYSCKVSQANLLPIDIDCAPFTEVEPKIPSVKVNVNVCSDDGERLSQKVDFDYETNKGDTLIGFLRSAKEAYNQCGFGAFFIVFLEKMLLYNFKINQGMFAIINKNCNEFFITYILPFFYPFVTAILHFVNILILIYSYFTSFPWLFRQNNNKDKTQKPQWYNVTFLQPWTYLFSVILCIIMFLFFFFFFPIFSMIPIFFMFVAFLKPLFMTGKIDGNKQYGLGNLMADGLMYRTDKIMWAFTFFIIVGSFSSFGIYAGIASILVALLFLFRVIPIPIYQKVLPDNLSPETTYETVKRTCDGKGDEIQTTLVEKILTGGGFRGKQDIKKFIKQMKRMVQ